MFHKQYLSYLYLAFGKKKNQDFAIQKENWKTEALTILSVVLPLLVIWSIYHKTFKNEVTFPMFMYY